MNNLLTILCSVLLVNTFSSNEILNSDNSHETMTIESTEILKENKVSEDQKIGINLELKQDSINALVGDSGKLDIENFEDIKLDVLYTAIKDNPYIKLESDGTWKALKAGETTIAPTFNLSEESLKKIEEKYPDKQIMIQEIQQIIPVKIKEKGTISIRYDFSPSSIETEIGSTGVITVGDFEDIPLTGTFKEVKDNPFVEVQKDGTWKALKAGETTIAPTFNLSEESLKKIEEKYPNKQIIVQEIQQIIPVKIKENRVTDSEEPKDTTISASDKPSGKIETLPKTGEKNSILLNLVGVSSICMFIVMRKMKK